MKHRFSLCMTALGILTAGLNVQVMAQSQGIPTPGQRPPLPPGLPDGIPADPGAWGGALQ